jgi:hypothetical protein
VGFAKALVAVRKMNEAGIRMRSGVSVSGSNTHDDRYTVISVIRHIISHQMLSSMANPCMLDRLHAMRK